MEVQRVTIPPNPLTTSKLVVQFVLRVVCHFMGQDLIKVLFVFETPDRHAGIKVQEDIRWITLIQNASQLTKVNMNMIGSELTGS